MDVIDFIFAGRTFAYKRLVQGLERCVSAFSSFMREYLDLFAKNNRCAQCGNDIGIAANAASDLTRNIWAVFECICAAGLKLGVDKCHFVVNQSEFLHRTISPGRTSLQTHKIKKFLNKLRFLKKFCSATWVRYLGFENYYKNIIPRMAEKLNPFYKLVKAETPINITSQGRKLQLSQRSAHRRLGTCNRTAFVRKKTWLDDRCKL